MEPVYAQMAELHQRLAPVHLQMQELHEKLEPIHRRIGEVHERLDRALRGEVASILREELQLSDERAVQVAGLVANEIHPQLEDGRLFVRGSTSQLERLLSAEVDSASADQVESAARRIVDLEVVVD